MKRTLLVAGLALALVIPAQSVGAGDTMSSPQVKRGFGIAFKFITRNGKAKRQARVEDQELR